VPASFADASTLVIARLVIHMVQNIVAINDPLPPPSPSALTRFHSRAPPNISIDAYIIRFIKYAHIHPTILISFLIYIDRFCAHHPHFALSSLTVHRFLCASVVVGCKAWNDIYSTNGHYARVGGVNLVEVNALELELLFGLSWQVISSDAILQEYYTQLVESNPDFSFV
ncbi:cyclin-domain-containing protein, partial [Piptocephalis cylindrospora]